jgi:feruloyl esterase
MTALRPLSAPIALTAAAFVPQTARAALTCAAVAEWQHQGTSINSAEAIGGTAERPAHCKVLGTVDGTSGFQIELRQAWNGKFLMGGGGGFAGRLESLMLSGAAAAAISSRTAGATTNPESANSRGRW